MRAFWARYTVFTPSRIVRTVLSCEVLLGLAKYNRWITHAGERRMIASSTKTIFARHQANPVRRPVYVSRPLNITSQGARHGIFWPGGIHANVGCISNPVAAANASESESLLAQLLFLEPGLRDKPTPQATGFISPSKGPQRRLEAQWLRLSSAEHLYHVLLELLWYKQITRPGTRPRSGPHG
jgi:hypothetical protein